MARQIAEIIADLEIFCTEGDYMQRLSKLTDELLLLKNKEVALSAMFEILERFPEEELGSPGPLVHAIEKCNGYESALKKSLSKKPSTLAIWMLYRLIKKRADPELLALLSAIPDHPLCREQMEEDVNLIKNWLKIK